MGRRLVHIFLAFLLLTRFSALEAEAFCPELTTAHKTVRFTYGVEWDFLTTFNVAYHRNFDSVSGFREDTKSIEWMFRGNGEVLAHIGMDLGRRFNLSLYAGYGGMLGTRIVPVSLRGTCLVGKEPERPGWLVFLDGGCNFGQENTRLGITGKAGTGYRIPLSRRVRLDFLLALRMSYAYVQFSDEYGPVPVERIRRNNNFATSLEIGISLDF
ncbi:MAG: hypothetical protein ACI395_06485 [Candidatus Cryptobacteroides sp.]